MNDYWIYENSFIFKPTFDKPIDNYIEIIKNYKKLIFSNYDNLELYIKTNNNFKFTYDKQFIRLNFNLPLENSLSNLTNLTYLELGYKFNQSLELLPNIKIT